MAALAALLSLAASSSLGSLLPGLGAAGRRGMEVVAEWRTVDFAYPSRVVRESAVLTGEFVPKNVVVLDVDAFGEGECNVHHPRGIFQRQRENLKSLQ